MLFQLSKKKTRLPEHGVLKASPLRYTYSNETCKKEIYLIWCVFFFVLFVFSPRWMMIALKILEKSRSNGWRLPLFNYMVINDIAKVRLLNPWILQWCCGEPTSLAISLFYIGCLDFFVVIFAKVKLGSIMPTHEDLNKIPLLHWRWLLFSEELLSFLVLQRNLSN